MPECSVKVHSDDCPWITKDLKRLILQRQKAFTAGKMSLFKLLRNKINRERKRCRKSYHKAKVQQLSDSKPHDWWRKVKQLCGLITEQKNLKNIAPLPKAQDIEDFNKDLRPIALTSTQSKIAEEYIIQNELKPKLLNTIDRTPTNLVLSRDQALNSP